MNRTHLALTALALLAACSNTAPATLPYFSSPLPGIYTSGQPSVAQFAGLKSIGISRVIHMRLASEKGTGWEEKAAEELGLDFVRLPIAGAKGLTRENVQRFADELAKESEAGTLVACGSSNRVGAMFALKAFWLDGATADDALRLGQEAGITRLLPTVTKLLK